MKRRRRAGCKGQAIAELVIALLGLTMLFFGLFQIARTGRAGIVNLLDARGNADRAASGGDQLSRRSTYIIDWVDGPDGLPHTRDDIARTAFAGGFAGLDSLGVFVQETDMPLSLINLAANPEIPLNSEMPLLLSYNSIAVAADMHADNAMVSVPVESALGILLFGRRGTFELQLRDQAVMPGLSLNTGAP